MQPSLGTTALEDTGQTRWKELESLDDCIEQNLPPTGTFTLNSYIRETSTSILPSPKTRKQTPTELKGNPDSTWMPGISANAQEIQRHQQSLACTHTHSAHSFLHGSLYPGLLGQQSARTTAFPTSHWNDYGTLLHLLSPTPRQAELQLPPLHSPPIP